MAFLSSELHVSQALSDYAIAFRPDENGFLWSKILPPHYVSKRRDLIRRISKAQLLRLADLRVGKGGRVTETQFKLDTNAEYACWDVSVETALRRTEDMEADEILQYSQENVYTALIWMNTYIERAVWGILRDPAILTQGVTLLPGDYWDGNGPDARPLEDLKLGVEAVIDETTHVPNLISLHPRVWSRVLDNFSVVARSAVNPAGFGVALKSQIENYLGVPEGTIVLSRGQYNSSLEDQPAVYKSFTGGDVLIAYVEPPSPRSQGLGQMFMMQDSKSANSGGEPQAVNEVGGPLVVYQYDDWSRDPRGATVHRLVTGLDPRILNPKAAYLIRNAVDVNNTARYGTILQ